MMKRTKFPGLPPGVVRLRITAGLAASAMIVMLIVAEPWRPLRADQFVNLSFGVVIFAALSIEAIAFFYAYYREKKLLKRALDEELCWGCLYSLKGCPHEHSLCPECALPRPGSKERWALWHPTLLYSENGYEEQERVARKAEKKAMKASRKVEDAALKAESSP